MGETTILVRRDTAANWSSKNPVLLLGEPGYDTTNKLMKIGDGATDWNGLPSSPVSLSDYTATLRLADIITKGPWVDARAYATLVEADAAAFAAGKRLLVSTVHSIPVAATINSACTVLPGGGFDVAGVLNIANPADFEGCSNCFKGAGSVVFLAPGTAKDSWFYAAEYGERFSRTVASLRAVGGEVIMEVMGEATTPLNLTKCRKGMVIRGKGAGFEGTTDIPRIIFKHTGVGIDCTSSVDLHFQDFTYSTDAATYPKVAFLLARNALGSGAGEHTFSNVRTNSGSKFSVANVYGYGSEVLTFDQSCVFINAAPGKDTVILTGHNVSNVTSPFLTGVGVDGFASGPQSNTTFNFFGCSVYATGGTGSNCIRLENVTNFRCYGGFFYNANAGLGQNGLAYVWIDDSYSSSNNIVIDGNRGEIAANKARFFIYIGGGTASTCVGIIFTNNHFACVDNAIQGNVNTTIHGLTYRDNVDEAGNGVKVYNLDYGQLDMKTCLFHGTAGGDVRYSVVRGIKVNVTLSGGKTGTVIFDNQTGKNIEDWTAPVLANNWVNYDAGTDPAGYRKDFNNRVQLRGWLKDGSVNNPMLVLPAGYRPSYTSQFIVPAWTGSVRTFAVVDVNTAGSVTNYTVGGIGVWLDLSGISFFTD